MTNASTSQSLIKDPMDTSLSVAAAALVNSPSVLASTCPDTSDDLCKLPGRLRINPSLWDKEDVNLWLRWAQREYSLRRDDHNKFEMNGKALCLLTKEDFRLRCPGAGDVLYELLQHVKQQRRVLVCSSSGAEHPIGPTQGLIGPLPSADTARASEEVSSEVLASIPMLPSQPFVVCCKDEPLNLSSRSEAIKCPTQTTVANGKIPDCRLLWDYVYHLLLDPRYEAYIRWEDPDAMVFRVVDPNGLARLWGNHKNRANMTYEKMSRALRHYYKLNIIKKEMGQRLLFRFLKTPEEIIQGRSDRSEPPESPNSPTSLAFKEEILEVSPTSSPDPSSPESHHSLSVSPSP
ncbi:transcription factor ETV7 isoform X3 [Brachyhypopomus gauderio]|uniref:transcription factor ETV7 isoform X3 n=1 Tax=Brachyhypopomus gauderio TaxID=698409 RepID=UPI00404340A1